MSELMVCGAFILIFDPLGRNSELTSFSGGENVDGKTPAKFHSGSRLSNACNKDKHSI